MTPEQIFDQDKSSNIDTFEIGNRIVRVERVPFKRTTYNENLGIEIEVIKHSDGSYMGEEMEFLGIFNRQICLRQIKPLWGDGIIKLHIDQWQDGWQKYVIPNFEINKEE